MTDTDRVLAVVQPAALAQSATLNSALKLLPQVDLDLSISPSETEWVAIYAAPLVDDDGGLTGDVTLVMKLNRPSSVTEIAESRFDSDQMEAVEVDGLSYLRVSGLTTESVEQPSGSDSETQGIVNLEVAPVMAVYEHDQYTYVVCEEGRLKFVLDRAETQSPLRSLVNDVDPNSPICLAVSFQDRPLLSDAVSKQSESLGNGQLLAGLASNADSVLMTVDLEGDELSRTAITASDDARAAVIEELVRSSVRLGGEFLKQLQGQATPETTALLDTGQKLVDGIQIQRKETTVIVQIMNPGDLPQFFKSLTAMVGPSVPAQ